MWLCRRREPPPPTVFTPPSWQLVSSVLTCKASMRTRGTAQSQPLALGSLDSCMWQTEKGRVSHCSLITKLNVDTRTQPFVNYGWRDFISVWSFHGSVWGWNYSRLRPLVPFLQLRLMLKATFIGCREQQKRQNIAKEAPDLSASTVLPSLSSCDHSLFHPPPH